MQLNDIINYPILPVLTHYTDNGTGMDAALFHNGLEVARKGQSQAILNDIM